MNQDLIDLVLKQIEEDAGNQDFTAIEELLKYVPEKNTLRRHLHSIKDFCYPNDIVHISSYRTLFDA